ncbi:MAG: CoA-binding protein [Nocardioides sp.]
MADTAVGADGWQDPAAINFMLDRCQVWAVVGLSGDPSRTAFSIAEDLQRHGKRIVPIHPSADGEKQVLGETVYASLSEVPFSIDVVDVFRRSEAAGGFADEAIAVGAKGIWFQLGVVDVDAFGRAERAGIPMVMDTCPSQQWRRRSDPRHRR